ncbi:hypothetical protein [Staphylococcus felis]|uniref:hypothetical protein n=1 Tax=Staphylococcus felis TaxID=46127 RepID=UPI002480B032|nr:hypothetical protein [Staphylococcus felis]
MHCHWKVDINENWTMAVNVRMITADSLKSVKILKKKDINENWTMAVNVRMITADSLKSVKILEDDVIT